MLLERIYSYPMWREITVDVHLSSVLLLILMFFKIFIENRTKTVLTLSTHALNKSTTFMKHGVLCIGTWTEKRLEAHPTRHGRLFHMRLHHRTGTSNRCTFCVDSFCISLRYSWFDKLTEIYKLIEINIYTFSNGHSKGLLIVNFGSVCFCQSSL